MIVYKLFSLWNESPWLKVKYATEMVLVLVNKYLKSYLMKYLVLNASLYLIFYVLQLHHSHTNQSILPGEAVVLHTDVKLEEAEQFFSSNHAANVNVN